MNSNEEDDGDTSTRPTPKVTKGMNQTSCVHMIALGSMKKLANLSHVHRGADNANLSHRGLNKHGTKLTIAEALLQNDHFQGRKAGYDNEEMFACEDEFTEDEHQSNCKEKRRGPTMMHNIHTCDFENSKVIVLNELGQSIGPVTIERDISSEYSRFLGTIARDYSFAPLTFKSWHKVPNKDKMWKYVLLKYIVPTEGKAWTLQTIGATWRVHKCRINEQHYLKWKNDQECWQNRPN